MFSGNFVFSQIMDHFPWPVFHQCVAHYSGDKYIKTFSCSEQYRCMDFANLLINRVCGILKYVCNLKVPNFITWVYSKRYFSQQPC